MSYRLSYTVDIMFCPDGVGQVMANTCAASMSFAQFPPFNPVVPGGNTLTQANLTTALAAMAADILNQVTSESPDQVPNSGYTTNLQRLQAFSGNASA